jgi:hypothetical protein
MSTEQIPRSPRWHLIPLRVILMTFIGTLLCFAASLLLAIVGTLIAAALHGGHPDMRIAYRHIALPMALVAGSVIFAGALLLEIRRYRQIKALFAIERMS